MQRKCVKFFPHIKSVHSRCFASGAKLPELTKDRYPDVRRGGMFNSLNTNHLNFFRALLKGEQRVLNDPEDCEPYNVDWIKNVRGYSTCILKPKNTEEVSKILEYCNENMLAVCPQGGNTGLVGGSVPVFDEIVLSTALMNNIISFDEISGALVCEAGCILENLDNHLAEVGYMMPLDLGAKGSCHIGGNVSANAGGLRLLRYGNLHGSVMGLEAVKADGEIVDLLSTLKKDNTGYHLKHLFIGSEGSLGMVTKVSIHCPPKPSAVNLAFLGVTTFEDVLSTYCRAKKELGEILSSFELIDAKSLEVVTHHLKLESPIPEFPFYILIETHGSNQNHDEEKLNNFLQSAMDKNVVKDGVTTNDSTKMKNIWGLRERITEGLIYDGYVFKYDFSIPIREFYNIVHAVRNKIGDKVVRVSGYGHIGDSNIHLNISVKEYSPEIHKEIEPFVYEYVSKLKGSVSAEHGIGFRKPKYLHYSKSNTAISIMKQMKQLMDPNGILNPYKVIPK